MMTPSLNWQKMAGLIPVVVQDAATGYVLMQAFMNHEAFEVTCKTGLVTFYSRSKKRLWTKGETSGHTLALVDIFPDCDGDALLITARPNGPVCHKGTSNCFPAQYQFDSALIRTLEQTIAQRIQDQPEQSYTVQLVSQGIHKICQKVGEESVELLIASLAEDNQRCCEEAADLLFHLLVLLQAKGLEFKDVIAVLKRRMRA